MTPEDTSAVPSSQPASGAPPQRTTGGNMRWTPPSPEHMARMLPQYDGWEMLGRGGMGAVYRARQANLDRTVAIKILPPEAADDEAQFIERFKNEARTMAKLDHPAIVAVYDFGETSEGQLYFVMAYVDGTDVSKMIQQGRLPAEHALAITAHVCDALQYAHEHGVVHRDIKPANVLLNQEGAVKVADFGLAKMDDPARGAGLTRSGTTLGTPDFVAPESLTLGMVADHRADLYAVGVMLYQMLTGRIPRGAWNPPSQIVPGIDPRYDAIVQKAMQHDREQRFQSAAEIRHALDGILTVPLVQVDERGQSSAAIPQQAVAQKPVAHRPGPGPGSRTVARPLSSAPGQMETSKPVLPLVFVVVAVLAVGAWFYLKPAPQAVSASGDSAASTAPAKAVSPPLQDSAPAVQNAGASKAVPEPAKPEPPKPVVVAPAAPMPAGNPTAESRATTASALPPELATLDTQFQKLQTERVTAPFETDLAKLNTGYLSAVEREIAKEKAAGHLDGILALESEKKILAEKQPIPDADDEKTLASLKALRATYRGAHAKLVAKRAANLKALTDPLDKRLAQMEADFTKGDRVADAKTVRGYREALAEGVPGASLSPGDSVATANPRPKAGGAPVNPAATLALQDGITNSLGMKFLPVKGTDVLFCIHETRYRDYAAYAADAQGVDGSWKDQSMDGFTPTENKEDHPVWKVTWEDAQKFCAWLSKKEGKTYRLPTDEEWSIAVGLGRAEKRPKGTTPAMLNQKEKTEFPWGGEFPPKTKDMAGNYSDESRKAKAPSGTAQYLEGYDDGFPTTAPVMSFKPNKLGLYDLGGNVWERCQDYDEQKKHVLRGGSWRGYDRGNQLSSARNFLPDFDRGDHGFRCVLVASSLTAAATPPPEIPPPARTMEPLNPAATLALKDGITNSLGMKFLPVKGTDVLFCIHETRRQDYAAYAADVPGVDGSWKNQQRAGIPISDKDDHPVVAVSWEDAQKFCEWLGKKEGKTYRLPTDEEWSMAVGLGRLEKRPKGTTPEMLNGKETTQFPWGGDFPPKTKDRAGNYGDTAFQEKFPTVTFIEGYTDGFPTTAPVMSFRPNKLGLYDMGGNVWEWVDDWWNDAKTDRVLRGASSGNPGRGGLLSSNRVPGSPGVRSGDYGFRCVLVVSSPAPAAATPPPMIPPPARTMEPLNPAATLALKDGITNTLGMKFLPVKGTDVLFCIHETRYKDYAAYAAASPGVNGFWKDQRGDGFTPTENKEQHPVIRVSWEDAQAFCAWLSKKEGKTYRLPTDEEWSIAVGLGHAEKRTKDTTPAMLSQKENTEFPWGGDYPPKTKDMAGNFSDESRKAQAPVGDAKYLEGYDDGFPMTAPVMSFKPNQLGLYDLGGNVSEWCEDWYHNAQTERVLRGGSWFNHERGNLLSSSRIHRTPTDRNHNCFGFRCVLVVSSLAPAAAATPPPVIPPPARTMEQLNPAATLALEDGITNTLGMKFLPVPGTEVLFCIHETRYRDYAAYAAEVPSAATNWRNQNFDGFSIKERNEDHPVTQVNWEDAQAFCAWLSKKEGKTYRLPKDEEWSIAVGLGDAEKRTKDTTPAMLSQKENTEFPWGGDFPPQTNDMPGNYSDGSRKAKAPNGAAKHLEGYDDGHPTTAPVMSFKPNKLGLYDLGGNVWEWCEDWHDNAQKERVLRGSSWTNYLRGSLLSSSRHHSPPAPRSYGYGFRCVLVVSPSAR